MSASSSQSLPHDTAAPLAKRAVAATAVLLGPTWLQAQDDTQALWSNNGDPISLERVTVQDSYAPQLSSPKFTEPVRDTPQTIAVIPREVYAQQGAMTLSDVLRNTPGITFFAGEGGSANRTGGDAFYLRGFDTSNSIFIDGVRDEGAITRDTFNVEQVEVVKGPSSENGRGGTAGYVNLLTKIPQVRRFENGTLSVGFDATHAEPIKRATLDLNQPFETPASPHAAFRLNLMVQEGGIPGREIAEKNRWSVAPSLALGLETPTRFIASYQHTRERNLPDYGLPSTAIAGFAPTSMASLYSPGVDLENYYGFPNLDWEHIVSDALTARVEHDFSSAVKISNQTVYRATHREVESSAPSSSAVTPAGEVTIAQGIFETKNTVVSNQTNLSATGSTGPVQHALTSGLELSRETAYNPTWSVVPYGDPNPSYLIDIYHPDLYPKELLNYSPHRTGTSTQTRIDTEALYAFDTLKLSPAWQATAGVRWEHYDLNEDSITIAQPALPAMDAHPATAPTPATAAAAAVAAVPATQVRLGASDTTVSWKTALSYKPAEAGNIYISYSRSSRPPGTSTSTNTLSTTVGNIDNPNLRPETSENFEIGAKWSVLHEQLLASAALFRSLNQNVPTLDPISGFADQSSTQQVDGLELGLSGKITDDWLIFGGYAWMKAKVSALISTNAQGLTLPILPERSGNLWTTYRLFRRLTLGAGTQYMGATRRLQAPTGPNSTLFSGNVPSYWVFSAMAAYTVNPHLTLRLNVSNLFNESYVASLNNNGYRVNLGAPRAFLLSAEFGF